MAETPGTSNDTLRALVLMAVVFVAVALVPRLMPARQLPIVGHDAPDFALAIVANGPSVDGEAKTLLGPRDLRGRAVLIDFWATWCGPCRKEAPIVEAIARQWRDRGVTVLGVDTDAPGQGDPRAFAAQYGLSYPIVRDALGETMHKYGVEYLPTLVVISRTGRVIGSRTGETAATELEGLLRQAL
jgi:thiol-disulfide isomerase/thioredoxin